MENRATVAMANGLSTIRLTREIHAMQSSLLVASGLHKKFMDDHQGLNAQSCRLQFQVTWISEIT